MPRNEQAAPAGTGSGGKGIADTVYCLPDQAANQRAVILAYLNRHGSISTVEARALLHTMHPAGRIAELRRMGHSIITRRDRGHRCARYHLLADGGEHAKHG